MYIKKQVKDYLIKALRGKYVPEGLVELTKYFVHNDAIRFDYKEDSGGWVAISKNFRHGSIVTSGKNKKELENNIKDAILTSFDVPSAYMKETGIHKVGEGLEYAIA
ncbi:MAG: hypothetical protein HOC78_03260 [Candidatus Komeilibacteria bacterium]|jgi:hypothetical protein|nr:hypothetical protein [Candidatus Komeilibacteria bacterium]